MPHGPEFVEVFDSNDRLLAILPRNQVHRQQLLHRAVLVLVFEAGNKLVLQRRSVAKPLYPGRWDLSVTGHVQPGESREEAAVRELWEELGISASSIRKRYEMAGGPETGHEFITLFTAGTVTSALRPNPEEIEEIFAVDREELDVLVRAVPEQLTPALQYFWKRDLIFPPLLTG